MNQLRLVHAHVNRCAPPKRDKAGATRAQRQQRQLAWAVYIAEGLAANMQHSLDYVSSDLDGRQKQALRTARAQAERIARDLRLFL